MSQLVAPASTPLAEVPGLGEGLIEKLSAAGVTTVEALADMTPEQLEAIEGIGPKTVEKISLAVNNYFSSLEAGEAAAPEGEAVEAAEGQEASPEDVGGEDLAGDETAEIAVATEPAETETVEQSQEPAEAPASSEGKDKEQ
jgi:N utilization substance protein A